MPMSRSQSAQPEPVLNPSVRGRVKILEYGQEKPVKRSAASKKLEVRRSRSGSQSEFPVTKVGGQSEVIVRVRTREGQE